MPEAERTFLECLKTRRHHFKEAHFDVAATLLVLGQWYLSIDESLTAVSVLQEAAAMTDKLQGKNDFASMVSLFTAAQLNEKFGNIEGARQKYEEMETKVSQLLGEDHHIVAVARQWRARFMIANGQQREGVEKFRKVVDVFRRTFGPNSSTLARRLLELGNAERHLGEPEAAFITLSECARIYRGMGTGMGTRHANPWNHAVCLHRLGAIKFDNGDRSTSNDLLHEGLLVLFQYELEQNGRTRLMAWDYARQLLGWPNNPRAVEFGDHKYASGIPDVDVRLAEDWMNAARLVEQRDPANKAESPIVKFFHKQAVLLLRNAIASGLKNPESIRTNPAFKPLRDRADFRELLAETKG